VARYREKDELDLAWNKMRRHITRELDTRIMDAREEWLNQLLTAAFDKYTDALDANEVPELEDGATEWIAQMVDSFVKPRLKEVFDVVGVELPAPPARAGS